MTKWEILKAMGSYPVGRNGRRVYSPECFRETFKPGDLIEMGVTRVGRISAIGHHRFLYTITRNSGENYETVSESAIAIHDPKGFRLIEPNIP